MRLIDADKVLERLEGLTDRENADEHFLIGIETARDVIRDQTPIVYHSNETNHDLVMRIVRAGLCARKPQHISVDPDGNVTVFGMTETAKLVAEEDRERHWHCSKCGTVFVDSAMFYKYCYECGAEFVRDDE